MASRLESLPLPNTCSPFFLARTSVAFYFSSHSRPVPPLLPQQPISFPPLSFISLQFSRPTMLSFLWFILHLRPFFQSILLSFPPPPRSLLIARPLFPASPCPHSPRLLFLIPTADRSFTPVGCANDFHHTIDTKHRILNCRTQNKIKYLIWLF